MEFYIKQTDTMGVCGVITAIGPTQFFKLKNFNFLIFIFRVCRQNLGPL